MGKEREKGSVIVQREQSLQLWFRPKMRKLLDATKVLRELGPGLCFLLADDIWSGGELERKTFRQNGPFDGDINSNLLSTPA